MLAVDNQSVFHTNASGLAPGQKERIGNSKVDGLYSQLNNSLEQTALIAASQ